MNNELKQLLQTVLREELEPIRQELEALKTDVSAIKETMATKDDLSDLPLIKRAVLETSDKVNQIADIQVRQEKILERLSIRSIEHEAEIAELRRIK